MIDEDRTCCCWLCSRVEGAGERGEDVRYIFVKVAYFSRHCTDYFSLIGREMCESLGPFGMLGLKTVN